MKNDDAMYRDNAILQNDIKQAVFARNRNQIAESRKHSFLMKETIKKQSSFPKSKAYNSQTYSR